MHSPMTIDHSFISNSNILEKSLGGNLGTGHGTREIQNIRQSKETQSLFYNKL